MTWAKMGEPEQFSWTSPRTRKYNSAKEKVFMCDVIKSHK